MKSAANKINPIVLFFVSLLGFIFVFVALYKYVPIAVFCVGLFLLFFIGLPWGGWFKNINKPILFGSQLAVILVFSASFWAQPAG